jgi:hypothetical protein
MDRKRSCDTARSSMLVENARASKTVGDHGKGRADTLAKRKEDEDTDGHID